VTVRRWLTTVALLLCAATEGARAQVVPRPPTRQPQPRPGVRDTIRDRADTLRARTDSANASDTTGVANFLPPDSVMQRLMELPGYSLTRYQAEIITFQAATRGAALTNRALVQRDSQIVKSDTVVYSGQSQGVQAKGRRNVFVVPGQSAPIVTTGAANYDMSARRIAGTGVRTSIEAEGQTLFVTGERYVAVQLGDSLRNANDINYYFRNGIVTACDDSIPDYYFKSKEIKRTGSFVVGRPAVLLF
jgi:lipopolysaccharide export system protein LptA